MLKPQGSCCILNSGGHRWCGVVSGVKAVKSRKRAKATAQPGVMTRRRQRTCGQNVDKGRQAGQLPD